MASTTITPVQLKPSVRIIPDGTNDGIGTYLVRKCNGEIICDGAWTCGKGPS